VVYYWIDRSLIQARRLNSGMPYWITLNASDERNSETGCATRAESKMAKHPQTLLTEAHYEAYVGIPSGRSPPPGFAIILRRTGWGL